MNNYHYIIAGLPELSIDSATGGRDTGALLAGIKEQCSPSDLEVISFLEKGYVAENLTADFYREAIGSRNGFLRKWFAFDLNVRNAKVRYLNAALGREKSKDVIILDEEDPQAQEEDFGEAAKIASVLSSDDIIARERGIDDLYWEKAEELKGMLTFVKDSLGEQVKEVLRRSPRVRLVSSRDGIKSTAQAMDLARELGRTRGDMFEIVVWEDGIKMVGNTLYYYQAVNQESDVIPENIDCIRSMCKLEEDPAASIAKTDRAMGI